jgi:antirestriction protein ArdC
LAQIARANIYASGRKEPDQKFYNQPKMNTEEKLVADLVAAMEKGVNPWRKPWRAESGNHRNPVSGAAYAGTNVILLELAMAIRGTDLPLWCGYGQAKSRGWHPRKASKAALILRPEIHRREEIDEKGKRQNLSGRVTRQ